MAKIAKWIFPAAGGKDGLVGTAKAVVGLLTGNVGLIIDGVRQVAGVGKKNEAQARQAAILQLALGEVPREAVLGIACTGGSLNDVFSFGGKYGTDVVTRCVNLADHAIDGIEGFYVGEVYYPWTGEGLQAAFSNKLSFHFRNATADGYEPPAHVQQHGGWPATDRMVGITHIWIDWYVDDKVWPQGHPEFRFVLRGLRVYDPRFDPALGYAGPDPQTWENRASHKFSQNAKVLRYAYTRGIYVEGCQGQPAHLLIGRGLTAEEAPPEAVIADANLCDELVDGTPRYAAAGVINSAQTYIEVDGLFAAAMAGVIVQREGTVDVEAGQAKAVAATFTDADLVIGEAVGFNRFLPDNDGGRINTWIPRYIEPSQGWKDHSGPVRRSLTDIAKDGGPREQTLPLPLVTNGAQADRVIEIQRLLARLERRASVVLPPRFAGLEEGDWVAWQSSRRHKGATVKYRIEAYREPETWRKYLTLREIASSVFGVPDPVEDTALPPPAPPVIDALSLDGVVIEAITLPGENSTLPAVRFLWDTPVDGAITAVRGEVRKVGETDSAPTREDDPNKGVMVATNGVPAGAAIEARLVPMGHPSRPVLPSAWITLSTVDLKADISPTSPVAVTSLLNTQQIAAEVLRGALWRAAADAVIYIDGVPVGTVVVQAIDQFSDDLGSFAGTLSLLGAKNAAGTGFVINGDTAFISKDPNDSSSVVQSFRSLSLKTKDIDAFITSRFKLTEDGAEVSVFTSVNGVISGTLNTNNGERGALLFQADDFAFADPNGGLPVYPLSYGSDNILRLVNVRIAGDLVVDGTITNRQIEDNTITGISVASAPGQINFTGTTPVVLQEVPIQVTRPGAPVKIDFNAYLYLQHDASGSFSLTLDIYRRSSGGAAVQIMPTLNIPSTGLANDVIFGMFPLKTTDVPGVGIWTYSVEAHVSVNNMTSAYAKSRYAEVVEYRTNTA